MMARLIALHILWTHPEALPIAQLASKRDAEKQMAGSLAWASSILCLRLLYAKPRADYAVYVLWLLLPTIALCLWAYSHYRLRVVQTPLEGLAEIRRQQHKEGTLGNAGVEVPRK